MEKYDVFISYSRKDTNLVKKICDAFDNAGISYFIDLEGIGGGQEFPIQISDAICESALMLFVASQNSYESYYTNKEISFANNEKKTIIPYIIDGSEMPRHFKFIFSNINWRTINEHPIDSILVTDIRRILGKPREPVTDLSTKVREQYENMFGGHNYTVNPDTPTWLAPDISTGKGDGKLNELKRFDKITNDLVLINCIGEGGASRVFTAQNLFQPGMTFAVKIFKENIKNWTDVNELNMLYNLNHPNIVRYRNNGITNGGLFYISMDFIEGTNLAPYIFGNETYGTVKFMTQAKPLTVDEVKDFLLQMISVLVYLQNQRKPIIHRDIKPQNIVRRKDKTFVLVDFNIATNDEALRSNIRSLQSKTVDETISLFGSLSYLPPENLYSNQVKWDLSSDTFSLGVTAYELLGLAHPWGPKRIPAPYENPIDIRKINSNVSKDFAYFIMKAISPERENRFNSAAEMADAFNAIRNFKA